MTRDPTCVRITLPVIYREIQDVKKEVTGQNSRINKAVILASTALTIALLVLGKLLEVF